MTVQERCLAITHGQGVYNAWIALSSNLPPRVAVKIAAGRLRRESRGYGPTVRFDEGEHRRTVLRLLAEAKRLGVTLD